MEDQASRVQGIEAEKGAADPAAPDEERERAGRVAQGEPSRALGYESEHFGESEVFHASEDGHFPKAS